MAKKIQHNTKSKLIKRKLVQWAIAYLAGAWVLLQALDAGSWMGPQFAGERMPTLAEALALARDGSEIYVDRGPEYGRDGGPAADETRFIEIWDLVFENYEVDNVKSKTDLHIVGELENKNIDTGAGLERLAYLLQGKNNIYETDEVFPVIEAAELLLQRLAEPTRPVRSVVLEGRLLARGSTRRGG